MMNFFIMFKSKQSKGCIYNADYADRNLERGEEEVQYIIGYI